MSAPDANGWSEVGEDFADIPNDCFDVIAKYYDAALDRFWIVRLTGCVRVDDRIIWVSPFPGGDDTRVDLLKHGYRPTHWAIIPSPPVSAP